MIIITETETIGGYYLQISPYVEIRIKKPNIFLNLLVKLVGMNIAFKIEELPYSVYIAEWKGGKI